MWSLGFDLGGTKTEAVVLSDSGQILARHRVLTPSEQGPQAIVQAMTQLRVEVLRQASALTGGQPPGQMNIGLATPGSLDPRTGLLRNANTTCLNGVDLQAMMNQAMGQVVHIENDANCFALAEAKAGAGRGFDVVLGLIMGTGCGAGWVRGGRLHVGPNRVAGEWGHISLDPQGPSCWCGQRGCVETWLSGSGLRARYQERTGHTKDAKELLVDTQDPDALALQDRFWWALGQGLSRVVQVLDPDVIVLGGGLSNLAGLAQRCQQELQQTVFGGYFQTPIRVNELGDSAGVVGAAWLGLGQGEADKHQGNAQPFA
jgi:fructokinase